MVKPAFVIHLPDYNGVDKKQARLQIGWPVDYDGDTIFSPRTPGFPTAYFGGPWLPMSYENHFSDYTFGLQTPLEILELKDRRKGLVEGIVKLLPPQTQLDLFTDTRKDIEGFFNQFLAIRDNGHRLYSQWSQGVNGKNRNLAKAKAPLNEFLIKYVREILMLAPCHEQCHGAERGWSVKKSLEQHLPLGSVLSFDLASAFDNVHSQYVFDFYYNFLEGKLNGEQRRDVAGFLTHLSTVYRKETDLAVLPQGSPISVSLFNRLLFPVDKLMDDKAKEKGLRYTRWVDDFTISAKEDNRKLGKMAGAIRIVREDFPIAVDKVFWQQGVPEFYLLGHKIIGNLIVPVSKEEVKNRGESVGKDILATRLEVEHSWVGEEDLVQEVGLGKADPFSEDELVF